MNRRFVLEGVPAEGVVPAPDGRWQVTAQTGLLDLGDAWRSLAGRWIVFELGFARSDNLPGAWLLAGGDQGGEEIAAFVPDPGRSAFPQERSSRTRRFASTPCPAWRPRPVSPFHCSGVA